MNIFKELLEILKTDVKNNNLLKENLIIQSKSLTPQEAIGVVERKDFPILIGKEVMIECTFQDHKGQAFTSAPSIYKGTIENILNLDIENNPHDKALFIAAFNAITSYLYKTPGTVHCKNHLPELCGNKFKNFAKENFSNKNIGIIGYQPSIIENLSKDFSLRVLDLNPDIVYTHRYGIYIEDGVKDFDNFINWCDVILCTGSTLANGSIVNFLNLDIPVYFYGTTISGMAHHYQLNRLCFESTN